MLYRGRGLKDPKEQTISSSRLPQVQLRGIFERYKGDLIDHVNPPSSRDRLEGFWSDEEKARGRGRGREEAEEEEEGVAEQEGQEGSEKGGSQQKLNQWSTLWREPFEKIAARNGCFAAGRAPWKTYCEEERARNGKCVSRGWPDKFPDGKTKCADRAPARSAFRFRFAERYKNRRIANS